MTADESVNETVDSLGTPSLKPASTEGAVEDTCASEPEGFGADASPRGAGIIGKANVGFLVDAPKETDGETDSDAGDGAAVVPNELVAPATAAEAAGSDALPKEKDGAVEERGGIVPNEKAGFV